MNTIESLKAMKIGVDHVVWSPLFEDSQDKLVYGKDLATPVIYELPGVMALNINPNMALETAYYDNGPGEIATSLGNIEVTFTKSALGPQEMAMLLGKPFINLKDETQPTANTLSQAVVSGVEQVAPWGALGFRSLKADGTYRYVWLYKGRFSEPSGNNETKGESVSFQSDEIVGKFVKVNHPFEVKVSELPDAPKKKVTPWKLEMDPLEIDPKYSPAEMVKAWFTQVIMPDYIYTAPVGP